MTVQIPLYLQNKVYTAKMDRQLTGDFWGIERIRDEASLAPAWTTGLNVAVSAGACYVQGDTNTFQGLYRVFNDASVTLTHSAPVGNPKIDLIVARVYDSTEVGSGSDQATIEIIPGTPNASASLTNTGTWPAQPASSMIIAAVLVPTAGSLSAASVLDLRPRLAGKSIVATTESRTNTAYGTLTTPDQVPNLVVPSNGLIKVLYQAMWKESVGNAASATLFIGSNQIKAQASYGGAQPGAQEAKTGGAMTDTYFPLFTIPVGLGTTRLGPYSDDVTTGQAVGFVSGNSASSGISFEVAGNAVNNFNLAQGGGCYIFITPGTYNISVQFKSTSGSLTVKNRKLWASVEDPGGLSGGRF